MAVMVHNGAANVLSLQRVEASKNYVTGQVVLAFHNAYREIHRCVEVAVIITIAGTGKLELPAL